MVSRKFCPLIKEECYGKKCIFWSEGDCILKVTWSMQPIKFEMISRRLTKRDEEVLDKLRGKEEKEILKEIEKFIDEELTEVKEIVSIDEVIELFLQKIGLGMDLYELRRIDPSVSLKLNKIKLLLRQEEYRLYPETYEEKIETSMYPSSNIEEKIKEFLQQNDEELSEELANFIKENFPDWRILSLRHGIPYSLSRLFWSKKGLPETYKLERVSPESLLKIRRIEILAYRKLMGIENLPQIPEELKDKSEEEIMREMLELFDEKIEDIISLGFKSVWNLSIWLEKEYCKNKGIEISQLQEFVNSLPYEVSPETPEGRIKEVWNKINNARLATIEELRARLPTIIEKKRKELLERLMPELLQWLEEKGVSKVTRNYVKLFLTEKDIKIPGTKTDFVDMLYGLAKLKLRELK